MRRRNTQFVLRIVNGRITLVPVAEAIMDPFQIPKTAPFFDSNRNVIATKRRKKKQ